MKTIQFQGHEIVPSQVVAVGPVEPDAELGCLAFTVFCTGGVELTFPEGKMLLSSRETFLSLLKLTL